MGKSNDLVWLPGLREAAVLLAGLAGSVGLASAADIEVIYSKKAGHPTANIPGTLDLTGMPAASDWRALEDFSLSPDGDRWMVKGRTQLGSDLETILVFGCGTAGSMYAQEGQPIAGLGTGELYDFFDSPSPVSFGTAAGNFVYSCRAKGGATTDDEKVLTVDSLGVQTLILNQGDPALGLVDNPPGSSGDELFGNSIGSVSILETADQVQFVNTPITNLHSSRYPALFRGNTSYRQSGVSMIGFEVWDSFDLSDSGSTPDGAHWYAEGDTENPNTAIDKILAIDDVVVLQEGSTVAGSAITLADIFQTRMAASGAWISRGDDPSDNDWVVLNGSLVAATGDPITSGAGEHWGAIVSGVACNSAGDYVIVGNTDVGDPSMDEVLVFKGETVVAREGDPVDLDGNGAFDDDAYVGRGNNTLSAFAANDVAITENWTIYFVANLHDAAGNDLTSSPVFGTPDAFMRVQLCIGDLNDDHAITLDDLSLMLVNFGTTSGAKPSQGDIDGDGDVDLDDLSLMLVNFGNVCT